MLGSCNCYGGRRRGGGEDTINVSVSGREGGETLGMNAQFYTGARM